MIVIETKNNKGFSLLETIVAVSILMITIVGPLSLASKGIVYSNYVKDEITGFYLAQEAMESIRNIRDTNIRNNRPWLKDIADTSTNDCINLACRLDIWNFPNGSRGISTHTDFGNDDARKNWETLGVVNAGGSLLYGYDFTDNIKIDSNGNRITPMPSIFSRRIIVKNITANYLSQNVTPLQLYLSSPTDINEINVTVVVSWTTANIKRSVQVTENMFSI